MDLSKIYLSYSRIVRFYKKNLINLRRMNVFHSTSHYLCCLNREAEYILKDKPQGCFLLRLSESKIGFVLSYRWTNTQTHTLDSNQLPVCFIFSSHTQTCFSCRGQDRCRHFIIEEEEGGTNGRGGSYLITGEDSRHGSLSELVSYYTKNPVGPYDEMLTTPCDEVCHLTLYFGFSRYVAPIYATTAYLPLFHSPTKLARRL